jgi:hypothetical protein
MDEGTVEGFGVGSEPDDVDVVVVVVVGVGVGVDVAEASKGTSEVGSRVRCDACTSAIQRRNATARRGLLQRTTCCEGGGAGVDEVASDGGSAFDTRCIVVMLRAISCITRVLRKAGTVFMVPMTVSMASCIPSTTTTVGYSISVSEARFARDDNSILS